MSSLQEFKGLFDFKLDEFQLRAIEALEEGRSVLVSAPTGIGKTVVAYYCAYKALKEGDLCIYTTPLKALSNQKFEELRALFGASVVGLATGDRSENQEAPVVVMTTEILRNMIHQEDPRLAYLRYVVLDEIHYLQDPYRGGVWEEVILQVPEHVVLACLSATASNSEELAGWITKVHGPTEVIEVKERPVPLTVMLAARSRNNGSVELIPVLNNRGHLNPRIASAFVPARRGRRFSFPFLTLRTPSPVSVVRHLRAGGLLPAIFFVFSRAGCERLATMTALSGIKLTTKEEEHGIEKIFEEAVAELNGNELAALDYEDFLRTAKKGIAAHHAGLIPAFKVAVEKAFQEGLIKLVFATETLSTGINMPAKTVVIERPAKYMEGTHRMLTRAEFSQMSGRAGRRGIDDFGYSALLASPLLTKRDILEYAKASDFVVQSAFRPTYNMCVNLVARMSRQEAEELIDKSLAAHQARRSLLPEFDKVLKVLSETECLRGWSLTEKGELLRNIYHEDDLLILNCLEAGIFAGLDAPSLVTALTPLCAEDRSPQKRGRRKEFFEDELSRAIWAQYRTLSRLESRVGLSATRPPVFGHEEAVVVWAEGGDLDEVLSLTDLPPGDFVRLIRQILDVLTQLKDLMVGVDRGIVEEAIGLLNRGIVAAY